jgi:alkylhydroperoxidase family enzyme
MAWIRVIRPQEATGALKVEYDKGIKRAGKVFQILQIQSLNPAAVKATMSVYLATMFQPSPLSRRLREMIATVVSAANGCHY